MKTYRSLILIFALLTAASADNPFIRHLYTADPATLVYNDTFYVFTGHDEGSTSYVMNDWHIFSTTNMVDWTDYGAVMAYSVFSWSSGAAWAGQCVYRNGKFYWYCPVQHKTINGKAIGVAVADKITGPYTDARGTALITNDMTTDVSITWDDIDPTVLIDDDGQAYMYWGNHSCRVAKLKSNMIEIDTPIVYLKFGQFEEAPFINKVNGIYYLSYADSFPERISYATSKSPMGPFTYRGRLNDTIASGSQTNHQALVQYKNQWYFVYHSAQLPGGGPYKRSVCVDSLFYNNADSTFKKVVPTTRGVGPVGPGPVKSTSTYRIVSRMDSKVLQVASGAASGALVKHVTWASLTNQTWRIDTVGYGVYKITNVQTGYCLDVIGGTLTDGTGLEQLGYSGAARQKWKLVGTGDGYYAIVNVNSGKVIDIAGKSTTDTATILQYAYSYATNQQWQLVEVTSSGVTAQEPKENLIRESVQVRLAANGNNVVEMAGRNLAGSLHCTVCSMNGKMIFDQTISNSNNTRLEMSLSCKLTRGVYIVNVQSVNRDISEKIFIR